MQRLTRSIKRLTAVATVGTIFQMNGCTVDSTALLSEFLTLFVNFAINNFVNAQLNVTPF